MLASEIRNLTPEEVEARLPLLVCIAHDIIDTWTERRVLRERRRTAGRGAGSDADQKVRSRPDVTKDVTLGGESQELAAREEERKLTHTLAQLSREVEQLGGTLLDPSTGTLEFPSLLEGRLVMLSWRTGETQVRFFRALDAPRGERRLLPGIEASEDKLDHERESTL